MDVRLVFALFLIKTYNTVDCFKLNHHNYILNHTKEMSEN